MQVLTLLSDKKRILSTFWICNKKKIRYCALRPQQKHLGVDSKSSTDLRNINFWTHISALDAYLYQIIKLSVTLDFRWFNFVPLYLVVTPFISRLHIRTHAHPLVLLSRSMNAVGGCVCAPPFGQKILISQRASLPRIQVSSPSRLTTKKMHIRAGSEKLISSNKKAASALTAREEYSILTLPKYSVETLRRASLQPRKKFSLPRALRVPRY